MRTSKLITVSLATAMLASTSALSVAADAAGGRGYRAMPPVPYIYSWTGFYAGGHVGLGWADSDGGSSSGLIGGGQVGFNYQVNQWVWGIEADISGTTIKDSASATVVGRGAVITGRAEASLDWVSTLAPRLGYTVDRWLIFGKVGGAWAHGTGTVGVAMNGISVGSMSVSRTVSGWVLGFGAEYALRDNWTAKIEYNMMDFGNGGPFADDKFHVLKAGINYRFGGFGGPF
ncbi:outer membrane protein [Bradyrhizobium sp.]|uniref:outer membrane protein n=1 Tax=Bradyrhizobium sp. TaxID=376 RepID=UPI003C74EA10